MVQSEQFSYNSILFSNLSDFDAVVVVVVVVCVIPCK